MPPALACDPMRMPTVTTQEELRAVVARSIDVRKQNREQISDVLDVCGTKGQREIDGSSICRGHTKPHQVLVCRW